MGAMTSPAGAGPSIERLVLDLFDRRPDDPFAAELLGWLAASARFRAFVEANRDKIRKKVRTAGDTESMRDVRAELHAARLLLEDRRIQLVFEAYGSQAGGPDFTVSFRGTRSFNLEVTRLRKPPATADAGGPLLAKVRQLPPSVPNVVVIAVDGRDATALDVDAATRALRARADARDERFFARGGFEGRRGFYERYLRLGAVLVWAEGGGTGEARAISWVNRSARIALPERALRACLACLRDAP